MSISPNELKFNCMKKYIGFNTNLQNTSICYIIDVSEDEVKKMDVLIWLYMEQVSFLILKKRMAKVWLKINIVRFLRLWTNFGYLCCCLS
jgi:hypothetical protein